MYIRRWIQDGGGIDEPAGDGGFPHTRSRVCTSSRTTSERSSGPGPISHWTQRPVPLIPNGDQPPIVSKYSYHPAHLQRPIDPGQTLRRDHLPSLGDGVLRES